MKQPFSTSPNPSKKHIKKSNEAQKMANRLSAAKFRADQIELKQQLLDHNHHVRSFFIQNGILPAQLPPVPSIVYASRPRNNHLGLEERRKRNNRISAFLSRYKELTAIQLLQVQNPLFDVTLRCIKAQSEIIPSSVIVEMASLMWNDACGHILNRMSAEIQTKLNMPVEYAETMTAKYVKTDCFDHVSTVVRTPAGGIILAQMIAVIDTHLETQVNDAESANLDEVWDEQKTAILKEMSAGLMFFDKTAQHCKKGQLNRDRTEAEVVVMGGPPALT